MKPGITQPEHTGPGERLAHGAQLALKIGVGALLVREVWKYNRVGDQSVADYAKDQARKFLHQARPLASLAFEYFQQRFTKRYFGDQDIADQAAAEYTAPVANPVEPEDAPAPEASADDTATEPEPTTEHRVTATAEDGSVLDIVFEREKLVEVVPDGTGEVDKKAKPAKPEVIPLKDVFKDADSLSSAYNDRNTPAELRTSLHDLVQAYRLIKAVPLAAMLWDTYVGPQVERLNKNDGNIELTAYELKNSANQLLSAVSGILGCLAEGSEESEQHAYGIFQRDIKFQSTFAYNPRFKFDELATSYVSSIRKTEEEQSNTLIDLSNEDVSNIVHQLVRSSSWTTELWQHEAQELLDRILPQIDGDITKEKITEVTQNLQQEATRDENQQAATRRVRLYGFFQYVQSAHNQGDSTKTISAISSGLADLDISFGYRYLASQQGQLALAGIHQGLVRLVSELDTDARTSSYVKDSIATFSGLL